VQYTVLAVGKVRPPFSDDIQHYQRLLARHARVTLIEVREDEQVERRIPDRAYVSLLDAGGRQIWTQTYDRQLANVFDIQSEIAAAVAATVAAHVTARTASGHHPNLEAYDHYLAGREFLHARNIERALERLQRAIEIDPDFAEAHAEWAIARLMGPPLEDEVRAAQNAIDRALALQPQLLRAQAARAFGLLQSRRDPVGAERLLREVLAQEPNMSDALLWLSNTFLEQGRPDDQLAVLQRAARIDPLHPSIAGNLANALAQQEGLQTHLASLEDVFLELTSDVEEYKAGGTK